ncbi:MAG: PAS domain-containing protein [Bacteroidota bacterium]|nr:hypothetical protein [Odoribacter sp.]MDP3644307.1 PAS domain-containing protein [Bacteroidota bacterium]
MNLTLRKKLTIGVMIVLLQILMIIVGVQMITRSFKKTTEKLIVEYHELHALQEFKMSMGKLLVMVNGLSYNYNTIQKSELNYITVESRANLEKCKQVLTRFHNYDFVSELETMMSRLENSVKKLEQSDAGEKVLINNVISEINNSIIKSDLLIDETKFEINIYEQKSKTAILHGSFTIISFGLILMALLLIGGLVFVRNLTKPIGALVETSRRISSGEKSLRVQVDSKDEFLVLADSFNEMLDTLDRTTVSEEYLKSIVDNLFGALVVVDKKCIIRSVNKSALDLFGYSQAELINKHISLLFGGINTDGLETQPEEIFLENYAKILRGQTEIVRKNENTVPVLTTCTILKNKHNETEGLIIVGHDLTERKAHADEIERIRNERLIAINEAQEEERMRIATDIHDGLGQMLTSIYYSLQELRHGEKVEETLVQKIQKQIDSVILEAKNIAYNLIPIVLKDFGLLAAIQNLMDKANHLKEITFRFNSYDFSDRLEPKLEKAIYRICQESVNNIIKHSKAKNASFQLFRTDELIVLNIEDDGIGFETGFLDLQVSKLGIGLISIRERVTAFNGTFTIDSQVDRGTELIVEIPYKKNNIYGTYQSFNS